MMIERNSRLTIWQSKGNRQVVFLDLDIWQTLLHHLELSDGHQVDVGRQTAMAREETAYQRMYEELYDKYFGRYVAVYQERLVEHDEDGSVLYERVRREYPSEFVLITPVGPEMEETHHLPSRQGKNDSKRDPITSRNL
jgi:hypothetical protein